MLASLSVHSKRVHAADKTFDYRAQNWAPCIGALDIERGGTNPESDCPSAEVIPRARYCHWHLCWHLAQISRNEKGQ